MFTTRLHDIIIPDEEGLGERSLETFNQIFLVINYVDLDLKKIFTTQRPKKFADNHVLIILYNLLCGINFLHSANVIHRDLKPSNVLINKECAITICDFGLARTLSDPSVVSNSNYQSLASSSSVTVPVQNSVNDAASVTQYDVSQQQYPDDISER